MNVSAMIFAAGLGSRLYPLTENKPKALVSVDGVTLLENAIRKIIAAGINQIVVNIHHFPNLIIDFLESGDFNAEIQISDERDNLLDTAGGLKFAEHLFADSDHILLYNVDIHSTINLQELIQQHVDQHDLATLAVRDRKTFRYLLFDPKNLQLSGWENRKTGEEIIIRRLSEYKSLAFSGIHIVKKEILNLIPEGKLSFTPLYLDLAKNHPIRGYHHQQDEWMDFGKYEELKDLFGDRIK
ncbi:NTP transferase domain-containing protein [Bacteroidales bacterium OttesenSCG-928-B11]|nr:NTP transferase domain-containing protein [Bacteroidales bacterium OttesenSCG-928-C03]MDL2311850.1 NTP transferase domain-containing protein [Bacteroidales bacterium OttesenSCG-928-B11]MDL2325501.1 NTP transferase domain-containing protein [Bacteroidales bacterium OttesenSCG-928-A14]